MVADKQWFQLPIVVDDKEIMSNLYLSANFSNYNGLPINEELLIKTQNKNGEKQILALFKSIKDGNYSDYANLTDPLDVDEKEGWKFYTTFLKKAGNPKIIYRFDVGNLRAFYISTGPDYPLMAIGVSLRSGNVFIHTPSAVNSPMLQAISELANRMNSNPQEYKATPLKPTNINTELLLDSLLDNETANPLILAFNGYKMDYPVNKMLESGASIVDKKIAPTVMPTINFYQNAFKKLKDDDTSSWFSSFTPQSRMRSYEGLVGASRKDLEVYRRIKLANNHVHYVMELGKVDILFFKRNEMMLEEGEEASLKAYVYKNKGFFFTNENLQFFLDEVLRCIGY